MELRIKRVYERPSSEDGRRILVDRLWPRGLARDAARLDHWAREVAPSDALRRWYGHAPERWEGFRARYFRELDERPEAVEALLDEVQRGTSTLLFGTREERRNNAAALRGYLESLLR